MATFRSFVEIEAWQKARELTGLVYVALDQGYVSQEEFDRLNSLAEKTVDLIGGLMRYLQKSSIKGAKYKR